MGFGDILDHIIQDLIFLGRITNEKSIATDEILKGLTEYVEVSQTINVMLDACGAEIEARGKADVRNVLGKQRGILIKSRKGASLRDYYQKKAWILINIVSNLKKVNSAIANEARYTTEISYDLGKEQSTVEEISKNLKENKKMDDLRGLLDRCKKEIKKQGKISLKDEKVIKKVSKRLFEVYGLVNGQGKRLKSICRPFFARGAFNKITKLVNKETKEMKKILAEEINFIDQFSKDVKEMAKSLQDLISIMKKIGKGDRRIANVADEINKSLIHLEGLRKLDKKLKSFEKKLDKIKSINGTDEAEYSDELKKDIIEAEKVLEDMEREEDKILNIENALAQVNLFLSGLLNSSIRASSQMSFYINYCTNAIDSARKMNRKNPSQTKVFMGKIVEYAEKTIGKILEVMEKEEKDLHSTLGKEGFVMKDMNNSIEQLIDVSDKRFKESINRMGRSIGRLSSELRKHFNNVEKRIKKDIEKEKKAIKNDSKISAAANKEIGIKSQTGDAKQEKRDFQRELKENSDLRARMEQEISPLLRSIDEVKRAFPSFRSIKGGFFSRTPFKKVMGQIRQAFSEEGHLAQDLSKCSGSYSSWKKDFMDTSTYLDFIGSLSEKAYNDIKLMNNLNEAYTSIGEEEQQLFNTFRQLEEAIKKVEDAERMLAGFERDFGQYLEGGAELFEETRNEFNLLRQEAGEIQKIESVLHAVIHSIPAIQSTLSICKSSIGETIKTIRYARSTVKKEDLGQTAETEILKAA